MKYVWMVVVGWIAWYIGIWGWAQIIGSFQHARERGTKLTLCTLAIWIVLLGTISAFVFFVLNTYFIAYLIGLGIALIKMLCIGKIE